MQNFVAKSMATGLPCDVPTQEDSLDSSEWTKDDQKRCLKLIQQLQSVVETHLKSLKQSKLNRQKEGRIDSLPEERINTRRTAAVENHKQLLRKSRSRSR